MEFYPVNQNFAITDGTAAPGTHGAPANLRNYTPFWRSGGDITVENRIGPRGVAGRAADEHRYLRRYAVTISDQQLEQDDEAQNGTSVLFDPTDARVTNERIYQRTYAGGHTRTVNCLLAGVGDGVPEDDVVMLPVTLQATGTLTSVGF